MVASDAIAILVMSADEYRTAISEGKLRRSVRVANDPTGRLAFHSFWDLLEFSLARSLVLGLEAEDVRPRVIEDLCDHLALSDEDVAVGTGDVAADMALLEKGWDDETGMGALPLSVVRHYVRLILRTLQQLHTVVGMMSAGHRTPCAVLGEENTASAPTMPMRAGSLMPPRSVAVHRQAIRLSLRPLTGKGPLHLMDELGFRDQVALHDLELL